MLSRCGFRICGPGACLCGMQTHGEMTIGSVGAVCDPEFIIGELYEAVNNFRGDGYGTNCWEVQAVVLNRGRLGETMALGTTH